MDTLTDLASLTQSELYQLNQNVLEEAAQKRPLMSEIQPLLVLRQEYEGAPGFISKIDWLRARGWLGVRCVLPGVFVLPLTCSLGGRWVMATVSIDRSPFLSATNHHLSTDSDRHVSSIFLHRTYNAITGFTLGCGVCSYGHRRDSDNSPSGWVRSNGGEWSSNRQVGVVY
jgi:hypothetical protein